MFTVCAGFCKGHCHKLCPRLCLQGIPRFQKFRSSKTCFEKAQENQKWWKTGFRNVFGKYLLVTNTVSSGFLMSVGDLIQQEVEYIEKGKHKDSFDWSRNFKMAIVGTFQGPFTHFFYQILDKSFPGVKLTAIATKVFLDQTIASPLCIILFFLGMNFLSHEDFETSKAELKDKFLMVYTADCLVWIPAQFINFYWLSAKYRVIYINLVTMCYNVFLSFVKHAHNLG